LDEAGRKTARLTFSAKTPVALPWGGQTTNQAYNILTFIQKLTNTYGHAEDDYDFLSEGSHPSFLQNTYFIMASKTYDNWSNESFRAHADRILERTISVIEATARGLLIDADTTFKVCTPLLVGLK
jgi:hypothetical protein